MLAIVRCKDFLFSFLHDKARRKFVYLAGLMFLMIFNLKIIKNLRDVLIMTSSGIGSMSFIKLYISTPIILVLLFLYVKFVNQINQKKVFICSLLLLLIFFILFALYIYPNRELLSPNGNALIGINNHHLQILYNIYKNWISCVFFVVSDIWTNIMVSFLFWQLANQIVSSDEAKKSYIVFVSIANFSGIVAGLFVKLIFRLLESKEWILVMQTQILLVCLCCVGMLYLYNKSARYLKVNHSIKIPPRKNTITDIINIFRSKYFLGISIMVIAYGTTSNLLEIQWREQVSLYFNDNLLLNKFMNSYSMWTGVVSMTCGLLIGIGVFRSTRWLYIGLITPFISIIAGFLFFNLIIHEDILSNLYTNSKYLIVMLGFLFTILNRISKFIFFDPSKEMLFVNLNYNDKTTGKASVDVVSGRFAESLGSLFYTICLTVSSTIHVADVVRPVAALFAFLCCIWIYATIFVGRRYDLIDQKKQ